MTIQSAWLEPTGITRGQDHLATRAICEIQYGQLLPGVTNVTDRGRYYTLYPWVLWSMDQANVAKEVRSAWLRRADCLLTLIALRAGTIINTRGAVGSNALSTALEAAQSGDGVIHLARWASHDATPSERYFKNKRGGLGQYYQGTLERLGILTVNDDAGGLTWTTGWGRTLAEAVDASADRGRFVQCIETGIASVEDLDHLAALTLAGLDQAPDERDGLTDVFWSEGKNRRSMRLILHLAASLPDATSLDLSMFRGTTATGFLPSGARWDLPPELEPVRAQWATYQRSEWLSMAVQGLFWATLVHIKSIGSRFRAPQDFANACVHVVHAELGLDLAAPFVRAAGELASSLADDQYWHDGPHEHSLARRIAKPTTPAVVAADSVRLLMALTARTELSKPFRNVRVKPRQLELYPVHLMSLGARAASWADRSIGEVVQELALDWGLGLHDRIAYRKLRQQMNDTFQVRPTQDRGYCVHGTPEPTFGNPRFAQAVRVLEDLGAIDRATSRPTAFGLQLLERADG